MTVWPIRKGLCSESSVFYGASGVDITSPSMQQFKSNGCHSGRQSQTAIFLFLWNTSIPKFEIWIYWLPVVPHDAIKDADEIRETRSIRFPRILNEENNQYNETQGNLAVGLREQDCYLCGDHFVSGTQTSVSSTIYSIYLTFIYYSFLADFLQLFFRGFFCLVAQIATSKTLQNHYSLCDVYMLLFTCLMIKQGADYDVIYFFEAMINCPILTHMKRTRTEPSCPLLMVTKFRTYPIGA